jgi:glycosyltransferase involved in cell wall biosynthesis
MKVALLATTLSPAAGGLATAVPQMAHALALSNQLQVSVIGVSDPAAPDAAASWGPLVRAHRRLPPKAFNFGVGLSRSLFASQADVVDVQGLWTYPSLANLHHNRRFGTPYVVTPHGMLDPWALQRSRWKKQIVRWWFENEHLCRAKCLRATAHIEAAHFRSFGLRQPIAVIPNGVHVPDLKLRASPPGMKRLLFLSRIHPKKGIDYLLRAWARLSKDRLDWELVIAGPDELSHRSEMKNLAERLALRRVQWLGAVHEPEKWDLYRSADLFVLPTHAENFGLVVAEALGSGVPVVTTRNAPWSGLEEHGCGWWVGLTDDALYQALATATSLSVSERVQMGRRGHAWVSQEFSWDLVADRLVTLYEWVAFGGSKPDFLFC